MYIVEHLTVWQVLSGGHFINKGHLFGVKWSPVQIRPRYRRLTVSQRFKEESGFSGRVPSLPYARRMNLRTIA